MRWAFLLLFFVGCSTSDNSELDMCLVFYVSRVDDIGTAIDPPQIQKISCNTESALKKMEVLIKKSGINI